MSERPEAEVARLTKERDDAMENYRKLYAADVDKALQVASLRSEVERLRGLLREWYESYDKCAYEDEDRLVSDTEAALSGKPAPAEPEEGKGIDHTGFGPGTKWVQPPSPKPPTLAAPAAEEPREEPEEEA